MTSVSDETVARTALRADADSRLAYTQTAAPQPRLRRRLLWQALLWSLAAAIAASMTGFFVGFVMGAVGAKAWLTADQVTTLYYAAGLTGAGAMLLYAARRNALISGEGDLRLGLGDASMGRVWLVVLLAILVALYGGFISYALFRRPGALEGLATVGWPLSFLLTAGVVLLAPLAEELFFRGWLWTAMRKYWSAPLVMLTTGGFWLILHLPEGLNRVVLLVPVAICIGLTRHFCGSVRASYAIHLTYNTCVIGTPLLMLSLR